MTPFVSKAVLTDRFEWTFSCGHIIFQISPSKHGVAFSFNNIVKTLEEKCPFCKEFPGQVPKSEAELSQEDKQALDFFQSQISMFEKQIRDAGSNAKVVEHNRSLLKSASKVWAETVKEIEKKDRSKLVENGHPLYLSTALQTKFAAAAAKFQRLHKAETILLKHALESGSTEKAGRTVAQMETRCAKLRVMEKLVEDSNAKFMGSEWGKGLLGAEQNLERAWGEIVTMMQAD